MFNIHILFTFTYFIYIYAFTHMIVASTVFIALYKRSDVKEGVSRTL